MKYLSSIFIALLLFSTSAFAIVDMKNANYSNTWVDLELNTVGFDLKVSRTYNSRSLYNGMFGFGWCSEYETTLEKMPEGTLKIKECGSGQEVIYSPKELSRKEIEKTVTTVISKMKEDKKNSYNADYYTKLSQSLLTEDDNRRNLAQKYGIVPNVQEGTKYYANGKEVENVVLNKEYYTRTLPDGSAQRYNLTGRLTHIYDKNNNFIKFDYDANGTIKEVSDNSNRRLAFKYYTNKKIKSITGPNGLNVEYTFVNLDDLGTVKNAWKHTYKYDYNEFHNLIKATWPDKTSISLTYNNVEDWVTSFVDRDNCTEKYVYESSPKDPRNHYWSNVKKTCGKEVVADNRYEFWHQQRSDGSYYLQRVLTSINGSTNDIVYHEVFGKPVTIRRNNEKIGYDYYPDGLVKTKTFGNIQMSFSYDPEVKKVSSVNVKNFDEKGKPVATALTEFKYDKKGNLNYAQNSEGQKITMTYDPQGRISTITDQAKKVVKIEYEDRFGKPATVTRPGLGSIKVSYKPNGDINKVDSKEGPSVAMQVASTFNNLLDIISPATAELYL